MSYPHAISTSTPGKFAFLFVLIALHGPAQPLSAQQPKRLPLLQKPLWQLSTILPNNFRGEPDNRYRAVKECVDAVLRQQRQEPLIPGFVPHIRNHRVYFRDYWKTGAVNLHDWKDEWGEQYKSGHIYCRTVEPDASLVSLLGNPSTAEFFRQWLQDIPEASRSAFLCANEAIGTLVLHERNVYSLDSLAIVPPVDVLRGLQERQNTPQPTNVFGKPLPPRVAQLLLQNTLYAYSREGKILWRMGLRGWKEDHPEDSHFLGLPLPRQDHLYCLNEKIDGSLRLLCVDAKSGKVQWSRSIDQLKETYFLSPLRRVYPVRLALDGNRLICPTHAGIISAVDLKTRKVLWKYTYREPIAQEQKSGDRMSAVALPRAWRQAQPLIYKGRVIFTAADDPGIYCLELETGKLLWKADKKADVYLAGIDGDLIFLVGRSACRALAVNNGHQRWQTEVGLPSGIGAFHEGHYFLPLEKGSSSQRPEVAVLGPATGRVVERLTLRPGDIPGNLVFGENALVSQTASTLTAYPLAARK